MWYANDVQVRALMRDREREANEARRGHREYRSHSLADAYRSLLARVRPVLTH